MHRDVLNTLMSIGPACLSDPATRAALTAWHTEISHILTAAHQGDRWTPARSQRQREDFLAKLTALIITDLARTAMLHRNVCGDKTEPAPHVHEAEEGEAQGEAAETETDEDARTQEPVAEGTPAGTS